MSRNVSKCLEMSRNVSKCLKMSQNVSKCLKMSQNVSKCLDRDISPYYSCRLHQSLIPNVGGAIAPPAPYQRGPCTALNPFYSLLLWEMYHEISIITFICMYLLFLYYVEPEFAVCFLPQYALKKGIHQMRMLNFGVK